jgi:hypothetical protein
LSPVKRRELLLKLRVSRVALALRYSENKIMAVAVVIENEDVMVWQCVVVLSSRCTRTKVVVE